MSYRFYSTSSVRVILYVSNSSPKVVISRNYNSKILFDIEINNSTSPEFSIPAANSELAEYLVVINNTLLADFTASISFEETPTSCYGHPQLYEGIVHHDVFVSAYEMNCYSYQSELIVGHDNITLDFVVTDGAASYGLEHRAYAISSSVPLSSWLRPLEGASLSTYRISARYMPETTYSFCFYSQDSNLTNREYYIIITRLSMTFVPLGYSHMQLEGVYEIFELVESNHNATSLAIEVTACSAQPRSSSRFIVGSSSFQEVLQGRYTQLTEYYQSQGVIVARLDVLFGYYYVGVKQGP